MSASVDNRVVKMEFDNAQFEQGVAQSLQSLTKLNTSLNDLENAGGFKGLSASINNIGDTIQSAFSVKGVAGITTLQRVVTKAIDIVGNGVKSLINNYTGGINLIGDALSGGQSRARNIEDAKFRLDGLGVAWDDLSKDINYAVKGTAYGLDSAAKAASQLVASGVQYGETFGTTGNSPMAKALRGISGVSAMTNSSYDEIAHIFTTVAGNGKMMTKELRMMSYRGLNVAATLRDYFNGVTDGSIKASESMTAYVKNVTKGAQITESELREMVTDGKVSADIFFQAMDHAYGEHATEANKTYAGSLSNVRAALSRLGAEYYQGHMDNMIEVFNALQKAVDKVHDALTPLIKSFLDFERMGTHGFSQFLKGLDADGTGAFDNILSNIQRIIQYVQAAFNSVFPNMSDRFGQAIKSVNDFLSRITIADSTLLSFSNGLKGLLEILSMIKDGIQTVLYILEPWTSVLNNIAGIAMYLFGELGKKVHIFNKDLSSNEGLKSFIEMLREISEKSAQQFLTVFSIILYLLGELGKKAIELVRAFSGLFSIEGITKAFNRFLSIIRTIALVIGGGLLYAFQSLSRLFGSLNGNTRMIQMSLANIDWSGFASRVQTAYEGVKNFAKGLIENAPQAIQDFVAKIGTLGAAISESFSRAISIVRGLGSSFYNAFKEKGIMGVVEGIVKTVPKIPNYFRIAFSPLISIVQSAFSNAFSSARNVIDEFVSAIRTGGLNGLLGLIRERIVSLGTGISEAFTEFRSNTIPFILENLSTSLSGAIERFRTFGSTIGTVITPIGQVIGNAFTTAKNFVTSFAGEFIEAFSENGISGVLEVARDKFQVLVSAIGDLLFDLAESFNKDGLQGVITSLSDRFQEFGKSIINGIDLSKVNEIIGNFIEQIRGLGTEVQVFINEAFHSPKIQSAITFFTEAFNTAKDAVIGFFTALAKANPTGIVAKIVGAITDLTNGFKHVEESTASMTRAMPGLGEDQNGPTFFEQIGVWFANIYEKASGLVNYLNTVIGPNARIMVAMAGILFGITAIPRMFARATITANNAIHTVENGLRDVKDEVSEVKRRIDSVGTFIRDGVKGIGTFVSGTITDITKTAKAFVRVEQFRKTLIPLSIAIVTIAGSLYVLSKIPVDDLKKAGIALGAAAGTFVILGLIVTLIDRHFSKVDLKNPQKNIKSTLDTVLLIAAAGGALLAAAYSLKVLSELNLDNVGPAFAAMTLILAELGIFAYAASKFAPGLAKGAVFLVGLGASLYLSCKAFAKIEEVTSGMRWQDIIKAVGALGGLMVAIGLFAGLSSKFSLSAGVGLLAILASFFLLEQVFNKIVSMDLTVEDLVTHAGQIIGALGLLTLIMATTKVAGKHAAGGGAAILLMTIAMSLIINMLGNLLTELKGVSWETFGKGIITIITVMGMMAVLMASTKLAGAKAVLVMPFMTAMMVVVGAIMGLMTLVAAIAPNAIEKATDALGRVVGMLAILMATTALTKFSKPTAIIALVAGLMIVCTSLVALAILPMEKIQAATADLMGIFIMLTLLSLSASTMSGKGIAGLTIMAGQLLIVTGSLIILANQPWEGVFAAAVSLGLVIGAIGAAMALASLASFSGMAGFAIGVLALIPMVWALQQLAILPWEGMISAATSLGIVMVALSAATLLAQGNILGALAFDLMSVGIIALAGALMILSQVDMTNIATQLSTLLITIAGLAVVGGIVGAFAAPIAIGFATIMGSMIMLAVGINVFCDAMLRFSGTLDTIVQSEGVIGSFISVIQTAGADLITGFITGVESVFQNIIDLPGRIIDSIIGVGEGTGLSALPQKALTIGSDMINKLSEGVDSVFNTITDIPGRIHDTILGSGEEGGGGLLNLGKDMLDAGKNGVKGLVSGLTDGTALSELQTAAENLGGSKESGTGVMGWFANMVGYNSPWYETILAGIAGVMGLSEGLSDPGANAELKSVSELLGLTATEEVANGFEQGSGPLNAIAQMVGLDASNSLGTGLFSGIANVKSQLSAEMANLSNMASNFKNYNFFGSGSGAGNGQDGLPEYVLQKQEEYNQMMEQYSEDAGNAADASTNFANATGGGGGAGGSAGKAAKSVKEAAEEAKRHEKAVKLQTQAVEEFIKTYGACFGVLDETTDATESARSAIEDLARTFGLTEDQVADTEAEIEDLFMNMYDTIHGSVDGSMKLFERFSSEMSVAPEVMLRNMRSNFTGIEEWSEEIQMLAAKGFSRGLVEELAKEGPASQAKVRTFLKMTFGQMMEANDLYSKKTESTAQATVKAITAMAFAGKTQDELIRLANDGTNSLESQAAKASLNAANHLQKVVVIYRELRDTVESVVESQIDLFSEFDMKTETSAEQMLANMQSQIQGTQDWANGLEVLAARGIDDGLLAKLAELGPKGYDQVNAFVQMTAEQLGQANQYYQQSLILPSSVANQVSTSYLNTGFSVAQSMISGVAQGAVQNQEQMRTGLQQAAQGAVAGVKADIQSNVIDADGVGLTMDTEVANSEVENADITVVPASEQVIAEGAAAAEEVAPTSMKEAGYYAVLGMAQAMIDNAYLVREAAVAVGQEANAGVTSKPALNENSPSKAWGTYGLYAIMGLANGMADNSYLVGDAAADLGANANTALQQALNQMNADGLDNGLQPTITPVLDLTDIQNGMGVMNGLLNSQTYAVNGIANIDPASIMNQSFTMLNDAINRLSMMQSQPSVGDINVTVNAQGIDDPNLLADVVAQRIYTEILSREAVVY